ncbi:quinone oxidoreductase [Kwoniella heveanensis CBS 569]|uniref:Quinone oxidoreductase n=1 Tax=Kwoniella heveanensis BCC8398 TaxID=1296120 RepID=A0A1B9GHK7_9TREE|nr:quinone oxidoreductase [Kwoniella heveanensis BCC8398]OCF38247.1 quinone oxidoreductase [Kwoniella heveanensis CBS 569]
MEAITYTRYGGPEVTQITTQPIPTPLEGEVQVRVVAGGLNPIDWHQRAGELKLVTPFNLPVIAGNEFSGVVSTVGLGVSTFKQGDRVICRVPKSRMGGLGSYAVMPAETLAHAPTTVSLVDAAGLPLAGLTAEQGLDALDVKKGDRILVTAGAGGVGMFAIQLAKLRGAHVTTTASDAGKPFVLKAGADVVVDYRTQKLAQLPNKFAKVFDLAGGEDALRNDVIPSVEKNGKIVSVAGPLTPGVFDTIVPYWKSTLLNLVLRYRSWAVCSAAASHQITYEYIFMRPNGEQLGRLARLVDEGKLVINIDTRFTLADFATAFERLESGRSKGKIVIEFPGAEIK